ncbi:MAG: ASCH domain-containing protein [Beduini sp.]|uniref:ASCH domain-containing protein n=1 Tax=Beduini sp. TaxID=1922300 RepID=UPI0039A0C4F0
MLTLPIKKKWFELILSGDKKEEYREIKPYYTSRFSKLFGFDEYGMIDAFINVEVTHYIASRQVCFRNGYSSHSPCFIATVSLSINYGKEEWGAEPNKRYYVLKIIEIEEVKENE